MAHFCGNIDYLSNNNNIGMQFQHQQQNNISIQSFTNNTNMTQPTSPNGNQQNQIILIAKFDYASKEEHELDLKKNERLILIDNSKKWWLVRKMESEKTGYFNLKVLFCLFDQNIIYF
jgi:hypothetical protein